MASKKRSNTIIKKHWHAIVTAKTVVIHDNNGKHQTFNIPRYESSPILESSYKLSAAKLCTRLQDAILRRCNSCRYQGMKRFLFFNIYPKCKHQRAHGMLCDTMRYKEDAIDEPPCFRGCLWKPKYKIEE